MSRPDFLLPHEDLCSACNGEKRVECSGVHPSRPAGGVSVMESPDTWTEECDECGGRGVVVNDRRARERSALDTIWTDDVRLDNALMNARKHLREANEKIARLTEENRVLRSRVTGVGVATIRNESRGMSSTRAPNGSAAGLEGDGPRVSPSKGV